MNKWQRRKLSKEGRSRVIAMTAGSMILYVVCYFLIGTLIEPGILRLIVQSVVLLGIFGLIWLYRRDIQKREQSNAPEN